MKFVSAAPPLIAAVAVSSASAFVPSSVHFSSSSSSSTSRLHNIRNLNGADVAAIQNEHPMDDDFLDKAPQVMTVHGDTLRTFDFPNRNTNRVQIGARGTNGRPLHSRLEYWHTPTYIPFQVTCYSEDGLQRPIDCIIETPKHPKTIAMFNTASHQMPFSGAVYDTQFIAPYEYFTKSPSDKSDNVQGGQIRYYNFDHDVDAIQVYIKSPEYNMKAKLEVTTGPDSVRQTYEVYCSSGYKTPFYCVIQTPGNESSTLRVINQNSVEFPFDAYVLPYKVGSNMGEGAEYAGGERLHWGEEAPRRPPSTIMGQW